LQRRKVANYIENFAKSEDMKGVFSIYGDTAENQTQIQMSMSAMILEEYGYDVIENNLVLIQGTFGNTSKDVDDVSKRKDRWHYSTIEGSEIKSYQPIRREINQLFEIDESLTEAPIGESIDELTEGQLEFSKDNKTEFVRKAWSRVKEDTEKGKYTWFNTFARKPINKTSEDAMRQAMAEAYESHENQKRKMPEDLRYFFRNRKHTSSSLMRTGEKSEIPSKLLSGGITAESHKLELGRDIRGLEDVGDDVLIATHKKSGEVTIMSLLPRYNGPIKFEEDGENVGTTIFGSYTDNEAVSKMYGN
jgi:hypothetical protein